MESAIYVVATPIGNLADISHRAIEVLKGVTLIAAEDTRHTRKLLDHYGIKTHTVSLHDHNELKKSEELIQRVIAGESLALVSDAGTPLISDPGHILVAHAKDLDVKVIPIPGPSALIASLSVSGIPCGRFIFEGFLPVKSNAKNVVLQSYQYEKKAVVFYESPHRIINTLGAMFEIYGERQLTIARELTKRFETIRRDTIQNLLEWVQADSDQQRGEFVLVLQGNDTPEAEPRDIKKMELLSKLLPEMPPKKASTIVAEILGGTKKELYDMALQLKKNKEVE